MLARLIPVLVLALSLAMIATPARAEWHKAKSEHFVIYSDSSANHLREFSQRLERYHMAMARVTGHTPPKPSPSNRVTVYAVGSERNLKRLYGDTSSNVGGFYIPRAGASVAFVPNVKLGGSDADSSLIILLHEYAHHFSIASTPFALPRWITEGSAEFFAAARFPKSGGVDLGLPANHRAGELALAPQLSIRELLDYDRIVSDSEPKRNAFSGQSWLLFHYLMFNEERKAHYRDYAARFMSGTPSLHAAEEAFGDLDALEKELKAYRRKRSLPYLEVSPEALPVGKITVTRLSAGMDAMMDVILTSRRGVTHDQAIALLPEARAIAAKYPDDPGVLTALAEAEFDAGNDAEAIAAADKALALDGSHTNAYVQQGFALFRLEREAEDAEAAFKAAMKPFNALNKIEADHPLPLIHYYLSFVERSVEPVENARAAIERALLLSPFDRGLRFNVAQMMIGEANNSLAAEHLKPLAADPHDRGRAELAKKLIALLAETPDGTKIDPAALKALTDDDEETGNGG
jgi:tetratricopeptide (TPR) repeat protein